MIRNFNSARVAVAILGLTLGAGFASAFAETAAEPHAQTAPVSAGASNPTAHTNKGAKEGEATKGQAHAQRHKNHATRQQEQDKSVENRGQTSNGEQGAPNQQESASGHVTAH